MKWTLIRSWAKEQGYKITREKSGDEANPYIYTWSKMDDEKVHGVTNSLSKVATVIYNHMTNNTHLAYQQEYAEQKKHQVIDYGTLQP